MGFIKGLFSKYIMYIVAGVGLSMGVALWYQSSQIESLNETISEKNTEISDLNNSLLSANATIESIREDLQLEQQKISQLNQTNDQIDKERREVTERLRLAQGRQETVWRNPSLVQRMIRTSYGKFADELACATGATEKCLEQ